METMSLEDVCVLLKIDIRTGRNRLSAGDLMPPSFRVGRRRLFLKDEVEAWLREQPKDCREIPEIKGGTWKKCSKTTNSGSK